MLIKFHKSISPSGGGGGGGVVVVVVVVVIFFVCLYWSIASNNELLSSGRTSPSTSKFGVFVLWVVILLW
jgi:hypothetical protein